MLYENETIESILPELAVAGTAKHLIAYRQLVETEEQQLLHAKAALSKDHSRFFGREDDHRLPYKRDVDRIIHSKAYARYTDKTQVVYLVDNDHITHRGLHVQFVTNFARGIAEILHLNVNLVEAIGLGHDVGHPPFAHEGEGYLSELSQEYGQGVFAHPWQSCRLFTEIEPLNLGLQVYDGFLCHDGGMASPEIVPRFGKTWDDHMADKARKLQNPDENIIPGSLEGCLVKLCDTMSYLGKDIEDAILIGILQREDIPDTSLGKTNGQILSALAKDVIHNSYGKDYIAISQHVYEELQILRAFNFKHIYYHPKLKVESKKIKNSYRLLFEMLLKELGNAGQNSYIWQHFLYNKSQRYLAESTSVQMVIDYISGMTDTYFVRTLKKFFVPSNIELD